MNNKKEIPTPQSTVVKKPWDRKTVPQLIQYVLNGKADKHTGRWCNMIAFCDMEHVLLTQRPYKKPLSDEDAVKVVRAARNLPESVEVTILYNDHPRHFMEVAFDAYRAAYRNVEQTKRQSRHATMRNVEQVLSLIGQFDPRNGDTDEQYRDHGWSY